MFRAGASSCLRLAKGYDSTIKAYMVFALSREPLSALPDSAEIETHRVDFELWGKKCPMAVENFARCCTGEMVLPPIPATEGLEDPTWADTLKPQLTYKETMLHKVIPGFAVLGGDMSIGHKEQHGTVCAFGDDFDAPEELEMQSFNKKGLLGTAVSAPHKNHSQFFVLMDENGKHLDGTCICFGRVTSGLDFLERVCRGPVDAHGRPAVPIRVVDCGAKV
uniref:Peptidyl-prolyl cis-trans isomerase n=1 Tax=Neobodo designis TaxID=312471 RepID=A0A7S1QCX4_NEODS|mmetsp:Transcript_41296/g.127588  ORF Transcript_41296/g.127588 Transcript_41296/m.127588 type:complete len:221 (+) Transcript_41296:65-727(+)|eukprot:CAMPEP_0174854666 /NCGR_PEP_ID=MMETSP1114-20130205/31888_1 /TAXON_ID=312471 /ORGANISM="Neobodo designis, Strain CCAP 1951/1" /LENGTH=220 /DNA_ID=CAMNT_0016089377 /DNA_START=62 /DNA_END=724 /DNA_ORIENTATION=+